MSLPFTILVPRATHPAVEERYGYAQARLLLTREGGADVREYDPAAPAAEAVKGIGDGIVVVLTDPLMLVPDGAASSLAAALETSGTAAVVPATNESLVALQRVASSPYLTLGQFQEASVQASAGGGSDELDWPDEDPGLFAMRAGALRTHSTTMRHALTGMRVAVARGVYAHRYSSQRGQARTDLLDIVPADARRVLEFGCGEGAFAAALKARQPCRVVGVELDPDAAAVARGRVDRLIAGDVRTLVTSIDEKFDWIVGGDIVEHLDDPWQFLRDLRGVCKPEGRLLLSLPNIACWPIVRDLLGGRFDYVYMGIACAGHLRFFTRTTIEDMLRIAGWRPVSITPQAEFRIPAFDDFLRELRAAEVPFSESDLATPGYYVIATPAVDRPETKLRIAYLFEDSGMSGGVRVALGQADALIERGHEVTCVSRGDRVTWRDSNARWVRVENLDDYDASNDDVVVGTFYTTLAAAHRIAPGRAVHLCQGYESLYSGYRSLVDTIDAAYRLPLPKMVVSPHLIEICRRFSDRVESIGQIIDAGYFRPAPAVEHDPLRLLVVGDYQIDVRGVAEAYEAVRRARARGLRFELVRVSVLPPSPEDALAGVDEHHVALSNSRMIELVHSCDVFLGPNHFEEGFCLPAAEAMASGLPVALTRIPAFLSYAEPHDYAVFADEGDVDSLTDALVELLRGRELRMRLRGRGIDVARGFDAAAVAERIERFLRSL